MPAHAESDRSGVPWRSGVLYVILASSLIGVMGISLISPILPDLRGVFGISDAEVGLVITAFTFPGIVLTPFVGLVADRIGRRRVIVPLLLVFGIAGAGIAFVDSFVHVLVLRFLQGVGGSALIALAVTLIGDVYDDDVQHRVVGVNASTISIGAASYPVIGGGLATIRWSAPFLFFGVAILVAGFAFLVLEDGEFTGTSNLGTYLGGLRQLMLLPRALAILGTLVIVLFTFYGGVLTALPLLLRDQFGLSAGLIGATLAISSVTTAIVSTQHGRLARWRSIPELIALGFVAFGGSFTGLWLAGSPIQVAVVMPGFGVGIGLLMPAIDTALIEIGPREFRAGVFGVRTSMLRLGQTLGPVAFTATAEALFEAPVDGYRVLLLGAGGLMIVLGVGSSLLLRR